MSTKKRLDVVSNSRNMRRRKRRSGDATLSWVGWAALLCGAAACNSGSDDGGSSSSHFLSCNVDVECVARGAFACDGAYCVDETGARASVTEPGELGSTTHDLDPLCDPLVPWQHADKLGQIIVAARDATGTLYIVDDRDGEYGLLMSDQQRLVRLEVTGSGSSGDTVSVSYRLDGENLSLVMDAENTPTTVTRFPGDAETKPEQLSGGEALTLVDSDVIDDYDLGAFSTTVRVAYNTRTSRGRRLVVVEPEQEFSYESMRLYLSDGKGEPLVERRVTDVTRARDGGSTWMTFDLDGQDALAYFPVGDIFAEDEDEEYVPPPGELTIGEKTVPLERLEESAQAVAGFEFWCTDTPPPGWIWSNQRSAE